MWKQKILPDWIWLLFCRLRLLSCIFCNIRLYVNLIVRHVLLLKLPLFDEWQAAPQQQKVEKSRRRRSYSIYQRGYIHVSFPMYKSCLRDRAEHRGIARVLVFIVVCAVCTLWGTAVTGRRRKSGGTTYTLFKCIIGDYARMFLCAIAFVRLRKSQSNTHIKNIHLAEKLSFTSVYSGSFMNYKVKVDGHARLTDCSKSRRYSSVSGSFQISKFTTMLVSKSNW